MGIHKKVYVKYNKNGIRKIFRKTTITAIIVQQLKYIINSTCEICRKYKLNFYSFPTIENDNKCNIGDVAIRNILIQSVRAYITFNS